MLPLQKDFRPGLDLAMTSTSTSVQGENQITHGHQISQRCHERWSTTSLPSLSTVISSDSTKGHDHGIKARCHSDEIRLAGPKELVVFARSMQGLSNATRKEEHHLTCESATRSRHFQTGKDFECEES